jgi:glycosyltransferase involved in cell wall biosynthesis
MARWFQQHGVDWVFYTAPNRLSFEAGLPYVMPVHDLQHRFQPEFPEVSANGEWGWREYLFRNGVRYATLILVDSEAGKEDVITCYGRYGVPPDRIKVLPFVPAPYLLTAVGETRSSHIRMKYHLPERYLFYPAQFWPHKNHARIVQAMGLLKEVGCVVHIVLCGGHAGEIRERAFQEVMALAHQRGVAPQVHYLGHVPDEDMAALYSEAAGLVMPTFFGPTNIPVMEAWTLGCPVLTSDLRPIRTHVGDAGLLVNPRSVQDIADGCRSLWEDGALRRVLVERGRRRASEYTLEDFRNRLADIVEEANTRVGKGGSRLHAPAPHLER